MSVQFALCFVFTALFSCFTVTQVCGESVSVNKQESGEKVVVPDGVTYKVASAEINAAAKKVLKRLFTPSASRDDILELFENGALICGPFLWREIKTDAGLSKLTLGRTQFHMPVVDSKGEIVRMNEAEGKLFQKPEEVEVFWRAFVKRTDFTKMTIRKLNPEELTAFWAMIPFDIAEPIFILESDKHKVLVVFTSAEKLKVMWIDDFQNLRWQGETQGKSP